MILRPPFFERSGSSCRPETRAYLSYEMNHPRNLLPLLACGFVFSTVSFAEKSQKLEFHSSFSTAQEKAKAEEKPLIVIFSAVWCPPCQQMKRYVYPSPEIEPYHEEFVWAYLDADEEENQALMQQYGVQGIPHLALHDKDGKVISQLRGAMGPDQLALELSEALPADQ